MTFVDMLQRRMKYFDTIRRPREKNIFFTRYHLVTHSMPMENALGGIKIELSKYQNSDNRLEKL